MKTCLQNCKPGDVIYYSRKGLPSFVYTVISYYQDGKVMAKLSSGFRALFSNTNLEESPFTSYKITRIVKKFK